MVSIAAFQAVDPGSIPCRRIWTTLSVSLFVVVVVVVVVVVFLFVSQ